MGRPKQTHCKRGHELSPDNLYISKKGRQCLFCYRTKGRDYRYRQRNNPEYLRKDRERSARNRRIRALLRIRQDDPSFEIRLKQNELFALVDNAVPKRLSRVARDDVIQSTILALLEGEISQEEIAVKVKNLIYSQYMDYDLASRFSKVKSLDENAFDDGRDTLHDTQNRNIWDM